MKRIICYLSILFTFAVLFSFTSCSKSDDSSDDPETALVGKWVEDGRDITKEFEVFVMELRSDYTFKITTYDYGKVRDIQTGTWAATDDIFIATDSKGTVEKVSYILKNNKLYIGEIVYARQ